MTTFFVLILVPLMVGVAIMLFDLVEGREPDWPIFWAALAATTGCFAVLSWLFKALT